MGKSVVSVFYFLREELNFPHHSYLITPPWRITIHYSLKTVYCLLEKIKGKSVEIKL